MHTSYSSVCCVKYAYIPYDTGWWRHFFKTICDFLLALASLRVYKLSFSTGRTLPLLPRPVHIVKYKIAVFRLDIVLTLKRGRGPITSCEWVRFVETLTSSVETGVAICRRSAATRRWTPPDLSTIHIDNCHDQPAPLNMTDLNCRYCRTWNCRTWKRRTKQQGMKMRTWFHWFWETWLTITLTFKRCDGGLYHLFMPFVIPPPTRSSGRRYSVLLQKFFSFFLSFFLPFFIFVSPKDLRDGSTDREPL